MFWPRCSACRILVPLPGIKPVAPAVEVWHPNYRTARELPSLSEFLSEAFFKPYMISPK